MTSPAIPGYGNSLALAPIGEGSPQWATPLPISVFEYGGSCQPRGIYLASGIPYPDVFPERQDVDIWHFAGPARNDFNPFFDNIYTPSGVAFLVGSCVQAKFTIYAGNKGLGAQIGMTPFAFVSSLRWSGTARGQTFWVASLVAAWSYSDVATTASVSPLFRPQGADTFYGP